MRFGVNDMEGNAQVYYIRVSEASYGNLRTTLERILDADSARRRSESGYFGRFELVMPPTLKEGVGKYVYLRLIPYSSEANSKSGSGFESNKAAYNAALECLIDNCLIVEQPTPDELKRIPGYKG
jgi:hypothetical protein